MYNTNLQRKVMFPTLMTVGVQVGWGIKLQKKEILSDIS